MHREIPAAGEFSRHRTDPFGHLVKASYVNYLCRLSWGNVIRPGLIRAGCEFFARSAWLDLLFFLPTVERHSSEWTTMEKLGTAC